jgi:hypothetical protein
MLLRPQSVETLSSQFYDLTESAYDTDSTLSIATSIYNVGAYKAGLPPVGTFAWTYQPVSGNQVLQGLFTCQIPASALGPGANSPGSVYPLTVVTIGLASDGITVRFTDVQQAFPRTSEPVS